MRWALQQDIPLDSLTTAMMRITERAYFSSTVREGDKGLSNPLTGCSGTHTLIHIDKTSASLHEDFPSTLSNLQVIYRRC